MGKARRSAFLVGTVEETIAPIEEGFINQFNYSADNSLQTFLRIDASSANVMDQVSILADIIAVINEYEVDAATGRSHASSALIPIHEKKNHPLLQTIAAPIKYLGGISFATAGIFIIFRFLGGQSILQNIWMCCGIPSWASNILSGEFLNLCKNDLKKELQYKPFLS
jgi:hypothetical protein